MKAGVRKMLKNFLQSARKTVSAQSISDLYTDDKSNYSSNPEVIFKSSKKIMKNFTPRIQLPKLPILIFLAKFRTKRKYLMKNPTFVRRKFL